MENQTAGNKDAEIPRLILDEKNSLQFDQRYRSNHQFQADILQLALLCDISAPEKFPRHQGMFGLPKQMLKSLGSKIFTPIIRLYMFKQIRINQIVLTLAAKVSALEVRLKDLEEEHQRLKEGGH